MLHFATHAAVSGQVKGQHEPGLVLTPPAAATEKDDGYLTASEVATLKLRADWVILSACNTAASGSEDSDRLSGLAAAFFYAGARSLLVSQWAVESGAAVKLTVKAVDELASNPSIGRSEARRRSMAAYVKDAKPEEAQPLYWAALGPRRRRGSG